MAISNGFRQPLGNGNLTEAIDADGFHVEANFNQFNPGFNAYHLGEDWNADGADFADLGMPVYAISNGTVVEKAVNDAFGNYLIIRHDLPAPITVNGITTSTVYSLYGHLQNPAIVSVGDVVGIGQEIGNVGLTGLADGNPHLHLEIRLGTGAGYENTDGYSFNGAPAGWVDPTDFINSHRTLSDTTAPLLSSMSPADNGTAVAMNSNIVLTFNENVAAGSGNILIYNSNGTIARTIAITDSSQVSFSGNSVIINPSSDLAPSSGYYVNLGAGVIKDSVGNDYAGISGSTAFNFTTAAAPPDLAGNTLATARVVTLGSATSSYTDYVGSADANDYYKFTTTGTTNFALSLTGLTDDADVYLLNSTGGEVTHSYNYGTAPEAISVSSLAAGTYYVQVKPYHSASTNYTLGLAASPGDGTAPLLSSMSPADNAAAVAVGSNIVLTFNEAVMAGSGNILIYNSNGTVARTIAVTDASQVSISGNTVTINPSADLAGNSGYYVNLGAGVIKDLAGNNYAGILGSTAFNFTTAAADFAGNTLAAARVVTLDGTTSSYTDYVGPTDTNDYYKFTTTGTTKFALSLTGLTGDADVYLLNSQGSEVAHSYNSSTAPEAISVSNLAAGTYYVQVKPYNSAAANYTLGLSATPPPPDLAGNTLAAARVVTLDGTTSSYTDYVGPTDTNDYYKFTTSGTTSFALSLTGLTGDADVYLLNSSGTEVAHSYNSGTAPEAINIGNLAAGVYYVQVRPYNSASTNYDLGLSATPAASVGLSALSVMPTDTTGAVHSSISYTLGASDQNLTLTGSSAINGTGNALANVITGNSGNNKITGGGGADILTGGQGADKFVFTALTDSAPSARDVITDFVHGSDIIDLSAIDANTSAAGNQAFVFAGQNANVVGHAVTWFEDIASGNTIVQADVHGNTTADLTITLTGLNHHLTASDFIL